MSMNKEINAKKSELWDIQVNIDRLNQLKLIRIQELQVLLLSKNKNGANEQKDT